jgi:hypothetical protein
VTSCDADRILIGLVVGHLETRLTGGPKLAEIGSIEVVPHSHSMYVVARNILRDTRSTRGRAIKGINWVSSDSFFFQCSSFSVVLMDVFEGSSVASFARGVPQAFRAESNPTETDVAENDGPPCMQLNLSPTNVRLGLHPHDPSRSLEIHFLITTSTMFEFTL